MASPESLTKTFGCAAIRRMPSFQAAIPVASRELAAARPDALLSDLAGSLNNQSLRLSEPRGRIGRHRGGCAGLPDVSCRASRCLPVRPRASLPGMLSEPPGADPHAGWCGRGQGKPGLYPIRCGGGRQPRTSRPSRTVPGSLPPTLQSGSRCRRPGAGARACAFPGMRASAAARRWPRDHPRSLRIARTAYLQSPDQRRLWIRNSAGGHYESLGEHRRRLSSLLALLLADR